MEAALRVTAKLPQHHSVEYHGIPIVIEWPKGSVREGKDKGGKAWRREMKADYGFIDDTEARGDEEPLDIYIGDDRKSGKVFIIEQLDEDGEFDEYKLVTGVPGLEAAESLYLSHYPREWGADRLGDCYEAPLDSLKRKVEEHQEEGGKGKTATQRVPHSSDFDEYVKGELRKEGLPVDNGVNWADYLYKNIAPRLPSQDPDLVFEALHEMLATEIGRGSLRFQKVMDKVDRSRHIRTFPLEKRITWYLKTLFNWRTEATGKYQERSSGPRLDPPLERPMALDIFPAIEEGAGLRNYELGASKAKEGAFFGGFYKWLIQKRKAPAAQYMRLLSILADEFYQNGGHLPFVKDIFKRFNRAQQAIRSDKRWGFNKLEGAFRSELPELVSTYVRTALHAREESLPVVIVALKRRGDALYEHRLRDSEENRQQRQQGKRQQQEEVQKEQWMAMASREEDGMKGMYKGEKGFPVDSAKVTEAIGGTDRDKAGTRLTGFYNDGPATCMDCVHRTPHSQREDGTQADSCKHPLVVADPELKDKRLPDGTIEVDADDWCMFARKPRKGGEGGEASGQGKKEPPRKASVGSIYMSVLGSMK